ncbi:four helix bundle protein [Ihuprevotella massiliensis]|uniref:four helix bundle protein n=1 Tax=Ihuprevotella massiliensis TaxID=1852368 RepID=UPI00094E530C
MQGKNHKELLVWQKAMQLVVDIYNLIRLLPKEETYGLSDQMRRAAISIPSNIAEGNARSSQKDMVHFLYIAQGSRAELETQLELCELIGYISKDRLEPVLMQTQEIGRMLSGLIKSTLQQISSR